MPAVDCFHFREPSQFGPNEDFQKYPRTFESMPRSWKTLAVDYLFAPEATEIYPPGFRTWVNVEAFLTASKGECGRAFRGVTTLS